MTDRRFEPGTIDRAKGRWLEILPRLGVESHFLRNRHGPCPVCGGKDRYRFDDQDGSGSFLCNQCGAGYGIDLLQRFHGWDFATAADAVDKIIGDGAKGVSNTYTPRRDQRRKDADCDRRQRLALRIWHDSRPGVGTPVEAYCRHRGITLPVPPTLRYNASVQYDRSGLHLPCMVCAVQAVDRRVVAIHRIWIRDDGRGKAGVSESKKSLGPVAGGAIRLAHADKHVALAESVEDGLALMQMTGEPVWSTPSASHLKSVKLPDCIRRVTICPDNDPAGREALEVLGNRLADEGRDVRKKLPPEEGQDWCELLPAFEERAAIATAEGDAPAPDAEMLAWYESIGGTAI